MYGVKLFQIKKKADLQVSIKNMLDKIKHYLAAVCRESEGGSAGPPAAVLKF